MGIKLETSSERLRKPLEKQHGLTYTDMLATKMMDALRHLQKVIRMNDYLWALNALLWIINIGVLVYIVTQKG